MSFRFRRFRCPRGGLLGRLGSHGRLSRRLHHLRSLSLRGRVLQFLQRGGFVGDAFGGVGDFVVRGAEGAFEGPLVGVVPEAGEWVALLPVGERGEVGFDVGLAVGGGFEGAVGELELSRSVVDIGGCGGVVAVGAVALVRRRCCFDGFEEFDGAGDVVQACLFEVEFGFAGVATVLQALELLGVGGGEPAEPAGVDFFFAFGVGGVGFVEKCLALGHCLLLRGDALECFAQVGGQSDGFGVGFGGVFVGGWVFAVEVLELLLGHGECFACGVEGGLGGAYEELGGVDEQFLLVVLGLLGFLVLLADGERDAPALHLEDSLRALERQVGLP